MKYCNYIKGAQHNFRNLSWEMLIQFHIYVWIQTSLPLSVIGSFTAAFAPGIGLTMINFYDFKVGPLPLIICQHIHLVLACCASIHRGALGKRKVFEFLAPIFCQYPVFNIQIFYIHYF